MLSVTTGQILAGTFKSFKYFEISTVKTRALNQLRSLNEVVQRPFIFNVISTKMIPNTQRQEQLSSKQMMQLTLKSCIRLTTAL